VDGSRIGWPRTLAAKRNQPLRASHLCYRPEESHGGVLHCFVLDCSGSMLAGDRLALAKGLLVALFDRARAERAEAALVRFGGTGAQVRFGPAVPRWWNERWLRPVGGGGGTPLGDGIDTAAQLLQRAARRRPGQQRWLWLLSDGRSSGTPTRPPSADQIVCVDFEHARVPLRRCAALAAAWDGLCVSADELIA
jgi:magnesium chelatase subunit ChlD-like protein